MKLLSIVLLSSVLLYGCGKEEVSFSTLENARIQAKENAEFNARAWRSQTEFGANLSIISRGDSSQEPNCPQGDGWSSMDLVESSTGTIKAKLKCSTVSSSIGCRTDTDFKRSQYSNEDGNCQPTTKVPHPLPKIMK